MAWAPSSNTLAIATSMGAHHEEGTKVQLVRFMPLGCAITGTAFSPDERTVASGWTDGQVERWQGADGRPVATLQDDNGPIMSVTFRSDGRPLVSRSPGGTVGLWGISPKVGAGGALTPTPVCEAAHCSRGRAASCRLQGRCKPA